MTFSFSINPIYDVEKFLQSADTEIQMLQVANFAFIVCWFVAYGPTMFFACDQLHFLPLPFFRAVDKISTLQQQIDLMRLPVSLEPTTSSAFSPTVPLAFTS
jgi:hypothetical protein